MFRETTGVDEYAWDLKKLTKYSYDKGDPEYTLSVDSFTFIPLNQQELDDLITFLNTLKEDGEI